MAKAHSNDLRERVIKSYESGYSMMKVLGMTRKKTFLYEERRQEKRSEFCKKIESEKENNIVYIDESGIKIH